MTIRSIWAQSRTRAIGGDGGMLWQLPEDTAFFKRATTGLPVVMGRKTWLSFPERFRPLPDRPNIVVTRDEAFRADGVIVVHTLEDGLRAAAAIDDEVWVIGGAEIYRQAMGVADELWVTEVDTDAEGDAYAPEIGDEWEVVRSDPADRDAWLTSRTGTRYRFLVYRRAAA
ncbi:dihydrofolate reductase [Microbacterium betulae]|uniref:Dihydrofolate reductase n=1 Tax=Microbacterium betulae TaxID=2981139 RepID=A0AA97FH77_9MICO|nr:dihydrofolate reductase [Microbacterium sp. AB]WOF22029.1 dihydrofolate reductase [Microbacterium sp. AB]